MIINPCNLTAQKKRFKETLYEFLAGM